jgi:hypothetical protein
MFLHLSHAFRDSPNMGRGACTIRKIFKTKPKKTTKNNKCHSGLTSDYRYASREFLHKIKFTSRM